MVRRLTDPIILSTALVDVLVWARRQPADRPVIMAAPLGCLFARYFQDTMDDDFISFSKVGLVRDNRYYSIPEWMVRVESTLLTALPERAQMSDVVTALSVLYYHARKENA